MNPFVGIEHVGLAAKDTAKLADWYKKVLGWTEVLRTDASPPAFFLATSTKDMVEIIPAKTTVKGMKDNFAQGYVHLAIGVTDYEAAVKSLYEAGAKLEGDAIDNKGTKVQFFRDPEGNLLHLISRPKPLIER